MKIFIKEFSDLYKKYPIVLVDVGASTLDVAGFTLFDKEGEDRYAFLTTDVKPLGAYICHINRINVAEIYLTKQLNKLLADDDLIKPIPKSLKSYNSFFNGIEFGNERELNKDFYNECKSVIHHVIKAIKKERDPLSECWTEKTISI